MYIIAGLGNPGKKYENTRHNMGFKAIDALASELGIDVNKGKFKALIGEGRLDGEKVVLVKPQTFMNLSGDSLREVVNFYKVDLDHLIVIYDDIDIPLGSIRIRKSGGPGTHNGMKSVVQQLGSRAFPRVRIGVGNKGGGLINHVIGSVPKEELELLEVTAKEASDGVMDIMKYGLDRAMNMNNTKKKDLKQDEN